MGIMVSEVYDAFVEAGASEAKARAAASAIPVSDQLATKQDVATVKAEIVEVKADLQVSTATLETRIAGVEAKMWKAGITIASLAVLLNKFLDWVIK